jgi:3-hydroxyacyl-CoA dehydrogenase
VAVITLDNPPLNGLNHELRAGVVAGIDQARTDAAVEAVIIIGAGRAFSSGADIREFNTPKSTAEPTLRSVIRIVEANAKPVIAAIGGICMGGGLELALGCHFRVASPGAKIALPEVKLGLLPGAGGTQRLPRLAGVAKALDMVVTSKPLAANDAHEHGILDAVLDGDLLTGAVAFAEALRPDLLKVFKPGSDQPSTSNCTVI